jgi:galactofuranosylgalactofuranosylrhamnosyl-N-acetylglucosaminyl-diphospho-decaprenol beta-1,5/1,6-galactofuranosyltransferase
MTQPVTTVRRVLQRVVLPVDHDTDVLPLYVDPDRPQLDVDKSPLTATQRGKLPPTAADSTRCERPSGIDR